MWSVCGERGEEVHDLYVHVGDPRADLCEYEQLTMQHISVCMYVYLQVPTVTTTEFVQGVTKRWAVAWSFTEQVCNASTVAHCCYGNKEPALCSIVDTQLTWFVYGTDTWQDDYRGVLFPKCWP